MSMDVGRYRHNYEGFLKKNLIPNVYEKKLKVPMQALWEFSPFFSFSLGEEV